MKKGEIFALGDEGWRCRESYRNGLILAQLVGGDEFAYIRRVGCRFERIAPKFTRENIVVGAFAQPVFSNARFDFVKIENGKVDFTVAFRTPVGRTIKCEIKNFDFETCLKKLNDVFVFSPTVEKLPADFRYIHPLNNDDWTFRIVEDCGKDIIFVEIWYKKRKIDGRYISRENLAEYLNAPFEFVKTEIKGEEKMTSNNKFHAHSDVIKRLIDCRKEIEDIVKNCKNPLDRLLDDDMPWRKQIDVLNANLPKGYSIKPQIVETGFAEDLKDGLHKD